MMLADAVGGDGHVVAVEANEHNAGMATKNRDLNGMGQLDVVYAAVAETSGSIVSPARECGLSALRPTFGRVSRYGGMTLSRSNWNGVITVEGSFSSTPWIVLNTIAQSSIVRQIGPTRSRDHDSVMPP